MREINRINVAEKKYQITPIIKILCELNFFSVRRSLFRWFVCWKHFICTHSIKKYWKFIYPLFFEASIFDNNSIRFSFFLPQSRAFHSKSPQISYYRLSNFKTLLTAFQIPSCSSFIVQIVDVDVDGRVFDNFH